MNPEPIIAPSRRRLLRVGTTALAIFGIVAVAGIVARAHAERQLVQWTNQEAVPTVQLAKLNGGAAEQSLVLPGNIQPYFKASIFARVSGYLKNWQQDIGAEVKAG